MKKPVFCFLLMLMNMNLFAQDAFLPDMVNLLKYQEDRHLFSFSAISMWGWSRNGKVAYSVELTLDGRGGSVTTAIIFDFVEDVIIWKNSIDSFDENASYDEFYQSYREICRRHGIEFIEAEFKELPIRHNNQIFNVIIEIVEEENESNWLDEIDRYTVSVETRGKKKIVQEKDDVWAFDVLPCGYFISPYENRALIVTGERIPAFEGADIHFYFIGCHLSYGFK
jgi:hypothetical protein